MKKIIYILLIALVSLIILPTSFLFFVGMMPTLAAFLIDKTKQQLKAMTVGCLNFAACFPYWLSLVSSGHTFEHTWDILSPMSMSVMYAGAISGYMVEWGVSLAVATLMVQKGRGTLRSIQKQKERLIERWGVEVTGKYHLDAEGFPILDQDKIL